MAVKIKTFCIVICISTTIKDAYPSCGFAGKLILLTQVETAADVVAPLH